MSPCLSVIVPVYNRRLFLEKAVRSLLQTDWDDLEILVVDDGSTDGSLEKARELQAVDCRVKVLRHPDGGNHGPGPSRNLGALEAEGKYLAFLDSDDWVFPNRFRASIEILDSHPGIDAVCGTTLRVIGCGGEARAGQVRERVEFDCEDPDEVLERQAQGKLSWSTNSIVIRRKVFWEAGGFGTRRDCPEDAVLWIKLASKYRIVGCGPEPVCCYHIHDGNLSTPTLAGRGRQLNTHVILEALKWARRNHVSRRQVAVLEASLEGKLFFECKLLRQERQQGRCVRLLLEAARHHPVVLRRRLFWANLARSGWEASGFSGEGGFSS